MTDSAVCPVAATADYLTRLERKSQSGEFVFSDSARRRMNDSINRSVSCDGLKTSRFGAHSLRSGGATACYVAGAPLEEIRRFGRWESCVFRRYIHHDELMYRGMSKYIARTEGFLDQLRQTNSVTKAVRAAEGGDPDVYRTGVDIDGREKYEKYRTGGYAPSRQQRKRCHESCSSVITRRVTEVCFDTTGTVSKASAKKKNRNPDKENCFDTDSSASKEMSIQSDPVLRMRNSKSTTEGKGTDSVNCLTQIRR